jgi:hypothetical protein
MKAVVDLLAQLDVPIERSASGDLQLRLVWLVKSPNADEFVPPPDDLKETLPALAKLGIDKPRLAAQTLVNLSANNEFRADGTVNLVDQVKFMVSGRCQDGKEGPTLSISVRAVGPNNVDLSTISTEITAPIGHLVVLGATPTRSLTSVFVVQMLRSERPKSQGPR